MKGSIFLLVTFISALKFISSSTSKQITKSPLHIKHVLVGDLPTSSNAMLQNLSTNTSEEIQELQESRLKLVNDVVTNLTEGDATFIRVLTILLAMFDTVEADRGKYKIKIQPTTESHPVFRLLDR